MASLSTLLLHPRFGGPTHVLDAMVRSSPAPILTPRSQAASIRTPRSPPPPTLTPLPWATGLLKCIPEDSTSWRYSKREEKKWLMSTIFRACSLLMCSQIFCHVVFINEVMFTSEAKMVLQSGCM
uniref:Uncharacterized protein n=1 Tax=Triticum urartu TaxID=4572 RepID=A0A8R7V9P2_TRIUA